MVGLLLALLSLLMLPGLGAAMPDPSRFEGEVEAYEALDVAQPPPDNPIVFVGSSSIRSWPDLASDFPGYPVLNRGFGGSTMLDLLYYFDRLVEVYHPALVVVYEGDNDLASGRSPAEVSADFVGFVALMEERLPGSGIAFISVKPSPSRASILAEMRELNAAVAALAAARGALFIDVYSRMVDELGSPLPQLFTSDNLHMNSIGYRLWRQIISPVLDQWAAPPGEGAIFNSVRLVGQAVALEWKGGGELQWASALSGPWTPITPSVPGEYRELIVGPGRFFRIASD